MAGVGASSRNPGINASGASLRSSPGHPAVDFDLTRSAPLVAGALIGLAAPAHGDPDPDASFLGALNNAGITFHNGPEAINIGRRVCQLMDQGHPQPDVIKSMTQQNSGFTDDGATKFNPDRGKRLLPAAHRGSGSTAAACVATELPVSVPMVPTTRSAVGQ